MTKISENISLRRLNSFGIDVKARRLIEFGSAEELREVLSGDPSILSAPHYLLAGGNNTLFTRDYDGTLLHPLSAGIGIAGEDAAHVTVRAEAGVEWDSLVEWSVERDLWGLENLSIIPGQVGAAPVQNIGAYGSEAKDTIVSVETLDLATLKQVTLAGCHCAFGYRESVFKTILKGKAAITSVTFRLSKKPAPNVRYGSLETRVEELGGPTLRNIRQAVIETRRSKLPDPKETGNAGSFFKNPVIDAARAGELKALYPDMPTYPTGNDGTVKLAAGWLIDRAGWKGRRVGNVAVHDRQALVLVNATGHATGGEVLALAQEIMHSVKEKFGIGISPEVNIL